MIRLVMLMVPLLVQIPGGSYPPLYSTVGEARIAVAAFRMDRHHVSRRSFAAFVVAHPAWRPVQAHLPSPSAHQAPAGTGCTSSFVLVSDTHHSEDYTCKRQRIAPTRCSRLNAR